MQCFTVSANEADQRLDKYLTKKFPALPVSLLYKALRKKDIKVNRKRADGAYQLKEGDTVTLYLPDDVLTAKQRVLPTFHAPVSLRIVYENSHLLLIFKPQGISMHGGDSTDSLTGRMLAYLSQKGEYDPTSGEAFAPAFCNRLDKNTSGIVIAAKNAAALKAINEKIRNREIEKKYLCLVHGAVSPSEGTITAYHKKDEAHKKALIFDRPMQDTKEIVTSYKVCKTDEKKRLSLVEVTLHTGRFHQIRAQFAHLGHPLVGDVKYGAPKSTEYPYQALCAYRLTFRFQTPCVLDSLNGRSFTVDPLPFSDF